MESLILQTPSTRPCAIQMTAPTDSNYQLFNFNISRVSGEFFFVRESVVRVAWSEQVIQH